MVKGKLNKFNSIIIILCLLFITGCSEKIPEIQYIEKPVYVEIPIQKEVKIKPIKKPSYKLLKRLDKNSTPKEVVEAYYNTILELQKYIKKLELVIIPFYERGNE